MVSNPSGPTALEQARDHYRRHAWSQAYALLSAADADGGLTASDLNLLAYAAYWTGRLDVYLDALERSYRLLLADGETAQAALAALMLQWDNRSKPAPAIASGWFARAERLLDGLPDCVAHGYLAQARVWTALGEGRFDDALALADRMLELGTRLGDRDLHTLGLQRRGQALIAGGSVAEGLALFEEAVVVAISGELEAMTTAVVYCTAIAACHDLMDYGRAAQWSDVAQRWCEREGSRGFPGLCRVYHAELIRLRGGWPQAEQLVRQACDELREFGALGMAASGLYELGEIRRRTGDLDGAERAYCEALELGHESQPGLALLRLAQGDVAAATAATADALADEEAPPQAGLRRARLLAAQVEIALAAGDVECARAATDELHTIAERYASTALRAEATTALAALTLADGGSALSEARRAHRLWQQLEMPYEAARARLLVAQAQRAAGHEDAARLQLQAAATTFERLGAAPDLERARRAIEGAAPDLERARRAIEGAAPGAPPQGATAGTSAPGATSAASAQGATDAAPAEGAAAPPPPESPHAGPASGGNGGGDPTLTRRELDVLELVAAGLTDRQIAERLVVSPHTVHRHLANIRGKLGQPTRAATVAHAARLGLL